MEVKGWDQATSWLQFPCHGTALRWDRAGKEMTLHLHLDGGVPAVVPVELVGRVAGAPTCPVAA